MVRKYSCHFSPTLNYVIQGFALNHNNTCERFLKKILPNKDIYTANLLKKKLQTFQPDLILIADLFYFNDYLLEVLADFPCKSSLDRRFFDSRLKNKRNY